MLEHLISPDCVDPFAADTPTPVLFAAQVNTASLLEELGSPEHILDEDEKLQARKAFSAMTDMHTPTVKANAELLNMKTPKAVRHNVELLNQYDWEYVEHAKNIRGYVVSRLLDESGHPDAKIRLRSLELLGKLTEVGSFTERIEVKKIDATADELQERLRAKLAALLPRTIEVQDATPRASDAA